MNMARLQKKIFTPISSSRLAIPLSIATIVGLIVGILIVGFIKLVDLTEQYLMHDLAVNMESYGAFTIILVPTLGGLIIGLIAKVCTPHSHDQGVPEVLKAITLKGGRLPIINVLSRAATSIIALGSGFSVGREGPAVHIGAGVGSNIARLFRFSDMRAKNLAACGAAAGISAVFNAPITGVMFALEVILRDFGARALSTVVVSSVAASVVSRIFLGESPAFIVPVYSLWSPLEMIPYLVLGVLSAFTAVLFIYAMDKVDNIFEKSPIPVWVRPTLGGLIVGFMGLYVPQIFGMGFHVIEQFLHGGLTLNLLILLVFLKILATAVSLGSGSSGGTFGPTLFVGGALGAAVGKLIYGRMPFETAPPGAYALVGMASVFAGAFHSPVTAILLVFEMTGDYKIILPLMTAAVLSVSIAQALRKESIDTVKFHRQGIDLESMEGTSFLGAMQVRDAMSAAFVTVARSTSAKELIEMMTKDKDKTFFTVNKKDEITGVIRPKALQEVLLDKNLGLIIADDIATPVYEFCMPDEPLGEAAHSMKLHNVTQIPVMSPAQQRKVIGVLKSEDIFRAYTDIAVKRDDLISRMEQEGSYAEEGAVNIRFKIPHRSPLVGKLIKELAIPEGVVLTSLQRNRITVIPEGNTSIQASDKIWAVALKKNENDFREWLKSNKIK